MYRLATLIVCLSLYCLALAQQEERLISDLFNLGNDRFRETLRVVVPPTANGTVVIDLSYDEIEIKQVDVVNGYISMSMVEQAWWTDERLRWNPSEYGRRYVIKVPSGYVWLPDIRLLSHSGEEHFNSPQLEEMVVIMDDGRVSHSPKRIFTFKCQLNLTHFPSDTQTCKLALGPWVHTIDELQLKVREMQGRQAVIGNNTEWTVLDWNLTSERTMYVSGTYQTVIMTLTLRRRPQLYLQLLQAPAGVVSFVLPLLHLLPPGCSQKSVLAGLLFVCSFLVHIQLYSEIGGLAGESAPVIVGLYRVQMIMIVVSIGTSSLTAALANTSHNSIRVPSFIRKVTKSKIVRICCCNLGGGSESTSSDRVSYNAQSGAVVVATDEFEGGGDDDKSLKDSALRHLVDELKLSRERRQLEIEWNHLALLVDRVAVIIFVIYAIVATKTAPTYEI